MGDSDWLLSPEAFSLLAEEVDGPQRSIESSELLQANSSVTAVAEHSPVKPKGRNGGQRPSIPGFLTLEFPNDGPLKSKRSKFDTQGREKVASVRRKGACLRCRVLKISVRQQLI